MGQSGNPRRGSFTGPIILIALGVLFLILNMRPDFDPWPILATYWPLILIFIGLGKIWDSYRSYRHPGAAGERRFSGASIALLILVVLFGVAAWRGRMVNAYHHDTQTVDLQGAQSVTASIEMPAGMLSLSGGSNRLLDAEFNYSEAEGKPRVDYSVSGGHGQLNVTQEQSRLHFRHTRNDWNLHFSDTVPLDLSLSLGAGQSDLRLRGLEVNHLEVNIGAGQLELDLTGERKSNLQADIRGGVGSATIRLPKNVGVRVNASGGIGSISAGGLRREGDDYVNDAYGKTPATIDLTVHGGIGEINLAQEP